MLGGTVVEWLACTPNGVFENVAVEVKICSKQNKSYLNAVICTVNAF